jgi:hypothetical protein
MKLNIEYLLMIIGTVVSGWSTWVGFSAGVGDFIFVALSNLFLQRVQRICSQVGKRSEREDERSSSCNAKNENTWSFASTPAGFFPSTAQPLLYLTVLKGITT